MNEAIIIWLYLSLNGVFKIAALISTLVLAVATIFYAINWCCLNIDEDKDAEKYLEAVKTKKHYLFILPIFVLMVNQMIPSKDELKYIIGGAAVWNAGKMVIENDEAKRLPNNVLEAANSLLDRIKEEDK